ncbi:MAG TPA: sugar transferase [Patescibacteria group bacterium]|nr:sugar transferase [Patescibacteria group bacterium]
MKKAELLFGALLVPIDYLMLIAAGMTAYALRFGSPVTQLQPVVYEIPLKEYIAMVCITAIVWLCIFALSGLYHIRGTRRLVEESKQILFACSTGVLIIIILFFFRRDLFSSRFIILAAYGFSLLYVTIARFVIIYVERYLFRRGIGVHHVALIGADRITHMIANELEEKKSLGLRVQCIIEDLNTKTKERIFALHEQGVLDEVIQTDPHLSKEKSQELLSFCDEHHITFKYVAALFDAQSSHMTIQPIAGIPIVEIQKTPLDGWGRIAKRIFDILGSVFLILLFSPIMVFSAIAILIDTGRPIFFARLDDGELFKRIGQFGKPFFHFKFRTMKPNTHAMRYHELKNKDLRQGSPLVKITNDPRITRVGKILRKYSIDELPEFFLVLKGDMSLVGPRPHLPEEVAKYKKHHKQILNMKPGITGLAQISGRSDLDFEDEVRLDTFYMENWSIWIDLIICIKTPFAMIKQRSTL